jgi:prepilin-type N-terminal cleavage/methylation domain-containing protein
MTFAMHSRRTLRSRRASSAPAAFTLIELMVVIVIMSLMVGVAIPALRSIMGTRSNEVAMNKISAFVGQARMQAIGLVQEEGVLFYVDPQTQLMTMALVYTTLPLQNDPTVTMTSQNGPQQYTVHFVDLVPNQNTETLPSGVAFQVLNSFYAPGSTTTGTNNEYAGYIPGPMNATAPFFAGLILFDSQGRAITVPYGCRCWTSTTAAGITGMGQLLSWGSTSQWSSSSSTYVPGPSGASYAPTTAYGFTLYSPEAFNNAGNSALTPSAAQSTWLDNNGLEVLVNRSNGTLVKSE